MTLVELQRVLGERIRIATDRTLTIEERIQETGISQTISSLAKQMINNADVVLRTEKLIAEGKLKESQIEKMVGHGNRQYGEPEDNFTVIANLWCDYLQGAGVKIDFLEPYDVAMMMVLFKVARASTTQNGPTEDTFLDIAGYAACGVECLE